VRGGGGGMATTSLQDHAVYDPAQRILLTLFPERVRATVTALVDGVAKRVGGVVGNLIVLGILGFGSAAWVGWIGLPVASLWLLLAGVVWGCYPPLLPPPVGVGRGPAGGPPPPPRLPAPAPLRAFRPRLLRPPPPRPRPA